MNKTALITGATSGIGEAAEVLVERAHRWERDAAMDGQLGVAINDDLVEPAMRG